MIKCYITFETCMLCQNVLETRQPSNVNKINEINSFDWIKLVGRTEKRNIVEHSSVSRSTGTKNVRKGK